MVGPCPTTGAKLALKGGGGGGRELGSFVFLAS